MSAGLWSRPSRRRSEPARPRPERRLPTRPARRNGTRGRPAGSSSASNPCAARGLDRDGLVQPPGAVDVDDQRSPAQRRDVVRGAERAHSSDQERGRQTHSVGQCAARRRRPPDDGAPLPCGAAADDAGVAYAVVVRVKEVDFAVGGIGNRRAHGRGDSPVAPARRRRNRHRSRHVETPAPRVSTAGTGVRVGQLCMQQSPSKPGSNSGSAVACRTRERLSLGHQHPRPVGSPAGDDRQPCARGISADARASPRPGEGSS